MEEVRGKKLDTGSAYCSSDELGPKLKELLSNMAQNVTTIESLITSMTNRQDKLQINEKMKETAGMLDEMLPLMKRYLRLPEPFMPDDQEKWWLEREKMNQELEIFLHNFQILHAVLGSRLSDLPTESLAEILKEELREVSSNKPDSEDDINLEEIVAEAEQKLVHFVNEEGQAFRRASLIQQEQSGKKKSEMEMAEDQDGVPSCSLSPSKQKSKISCRQS